ncbi:uncharacterized protein G2W53_024860 [Senna tora]|uniref:Uncharacterized protein n=1 Tax=Senna tora TaxID=362788 RepID=A0A834TCR6_9FABA|nr:uncharacterized protein G2W53_024860 [Senna tora]
MGHLRLAGMILPKEKEKHRFARIYSYRRTSKDIGAEADESM